MQIGNTHNVHTYVYAHSHSLCLYIQTYVHKAFVHLPYNAHICTYILSRAFLKILLEPLKSMNPRICIFMHVHTYVHCYIHIIYAYCHQTIKCLKNIFRFLKISDTTDQSLELTADSQDLTGVTEITLTPPVRTSSVCNGPSSFTETHRYANAYVPALQLGWVIRVIQVKWVPSTL